MAFNESKTGRALGAPLHYGPLDSITIPTGDSDFYLSGNGPFTDPAPISLATDTPANHGLDDKKLAAGARALKEINASRSFLVMRDGILVYESYLHGASVTDANNIHSASKSITSCLVGELIEAGQLTLDSTPAEVFGDKFTYADRYTGDTKLSDWLRMMSGLKYEEDDTEYTFRTNFLRDIFNLPRAGTPGTIANYSTADAYVVCCMVQEASGESIPHLLQRKFGGCCYPVKIGLSPEGYYFCGCNFFLTPRRMSAFGQMCLDAIKGEPGALLSQSWIDLATTKHSTIAADDGDHDYGYFWWLDSTVDGHKGFRAWGWGKQFVFVYPDDNLVCVITSDTNGQHVHDCDLREDIIRPYVIGAITN